MIYNIDDLGNVQDLHIIGDDFFLGDFDAYIFQYTLMHLGIHCAYSKNLSVVSIYEDTDEWQANRVKQVLKRYGVGNEVLKQIRGIRCHDFD